jgi:hypothetical protein
VSVERCPFCGEHVVLPQGCDLITGIADVDMGHPEERPFSSAGQSACTTGHAAVPTTSSSRTRRSHSGGKVIP